MMQTPFSFAEASRTQLRRGVKDEHKAVLSPDHYPSNLAASQPSVICIEALCNRFSRDF
jgi:hypothetical protein